MTSEQRNQTRLALYRYGMRQRARSPVERSWCAAIEEGLAITVKTIRCVRICSSCAMCSTARRTM